MELLRDFFTNSWVVSILTGLVVYLITKLWETIRAKKNYIQAVQSANKEVFNTLKLCVPEETLPDVYNLLALHFATAKRYSVKQVDMDTLDLIIFDLIKEIMDSSFLSYRDKLQYCSKLKKLELSFSDAVSEYQSKQLPDDSDRKTKYFGEILISPALALGFTSTLIALGVEMKISINKLINNINVIESLVLILAFATLTIAVLSITKRK